MFSDLKIGILGGGQLGAMLIRHAIDFGLRISVLDKDPEAPCSRYSSLFTSGDPLSYDAVLTFGRGLDVITIETESVNSEALHVLQKEGVKVFPKPEMLEIIQDKYRQKTFLESLNIPVSKGIPVQNRAELNQHVDKLPAILKKCRSGYDGYGVMMLKSASDIEQAFDEASVLEELVNIQHEISVLVARNEHGEIGCYDPVMMEFNKERFILDYQFAPADISQVQTLEAQNLAKQIAEALDLVGLLAVEMFITTDGRILVNEMAPRPHNSGHHTMEAASTSQFEQLLRAITGLPLGDTALNNASVMINILEPAPNQAMSMEEKLNKLLQIPGVHLHWYGKKSGRPGRKMGHLTVTGRTAEIALQKAEQARNLLK